MFKVKKLSFVLLLTSSAMAMAVQAGQSSATNTVKGRAPVASSVMATNTTSTIPVEVRPTVQPRVGHQLTAGYSFSDPDGDSESGTVYQWLRNGNPISGAASATYTTVSADNGANVSVRITPQTSATATDPNIGSEAASPALAVTANAVAIDRFLAPDVTLRNWGGADSYCRGLGARLPDRAELQQLFIAATSATATGQINTEMCSLYGWPLSGQCGGSSHYYWSSTSGGTAGHYYVYLHNGYAFSSGDSYTNQVVCIR